MQCPDCGGPVYDNRQKKASGQYKPGAPDFACRDKEGCGWKKFPPKNRQRSGAGNGESGAARNTNGAALSRASRPLGPLYYQSLRIASESVKKLVPNAQPADIIAAAATVFIGATHTGAPLMPPPKPKPEPEPEPEYDDTDRSLQEEADDLPFD